MTASKPRNSASLIGRFSEKFGIDAWFSTLSMLTLMTWGLVTKSTAGGGASSNATIACGFIGIVILFFWGKAHWRTGLLSVLSLGCFGYIGIFGDNGEVSSMMHFAGKLMKHTPFIDSDRGRWEIVALFSTAYMAAIYLDMIIDHSSGFSKNGAKGNFLGPIFVLLVLSIIALIGSAVALHDTPWHFGLIVLVSIFFLISDILVYFGLRDCDDKDCRSLAIESRLLIFLVDLPIIVGFIVLIFFNNQLGCEAGHEIKPFLDQGWRNKDLRCFEFHPFLAGALAFQMIAFNTIYAFVQFDWHRDPRSLGKLTA